MIWLYLVIIAQFLSAVVYMIDKYLVAKAITKPVVYAFYVGMMSGVVLLLLPFGVVVSPTLKVILFSLAVATTYTFSLLLLYNSLQTADASDVAPVIGAVTAVSTVVFSFLFLKNGFPTNFIWGFPLLMLGTLLMSAFRFDRKATLYVILGGILFGLSSVFIKMIFNETSFFNGFFWSRMANVIGAAALLLWPTNTKAIAENFRTSKSETKFLVVGNKILAGFSFILVLLAIKLSEVSLVNALAGIQFVFVLILAFIFTYKMPKYFHEAVHHEGNRLKKIIASAFIIAGFLILFI